MLEHVICREILAIHATLSSRSMPWYTPGSVLEGCPWTTLQRRHNGHDSFSDHHPHDCLLDRLFRRRSKKTSKLRVTGLCAGNSPVPGEFPAQRASNADNVSIWWRHHVAVIPITDILTNADRGTRSNQPQLNSLSQKAVFFLESPLQVVSEHSPTTHPATYHTENTFDVSATSNIGSSNVLMFGMAYVFQNCIFCCLIKSNNCE